MGIQGLLRFLKDATNEIHIREYSGRCVAVDTYCWLHRGAFACADKLAKGEKTDQYVKYCMKFVDMLESYNVRPILVFDGCRLPSKKEVEKQRRERRELYMQKGKQFLREGRLSEARDAFTKCVSVTPQMALAVMKVARDRGVDCIVAPYEADAQLAFLLKHGYAQAVVTEDSDLLCFGCEKVILKMDLTGRAQEVSLDRMENVKNLQGFTTDTFRHMCILSGCDYLTNIKGVGLAKSCKALKLAKNKDIYQTIRKLHQYIKGLGPVEADYAIGFERADKTFLYQLVVDPKSRKIVPLNPYPPDITHKEVKYAGPSIPDAQGLQIAWGNVDVNTGERLGDFNADKWLRSKQWNGDSVMRRNSIWQKDFFARANANKVSGDNQRKMRKIEIPSLRGQEAIIDVKNIAIFRKKKADLLAGEAASELCSQNSDSGEKKLIDVENGFHDTIKDDQVDLVNVYKEAEIATKVSPRKLSLRQRMRSKPNTGSGSKTVVKSRFFTAATAEPSFFEESATVSISEVEETPETSNSSYTHAPAPPTVEADIALHEILQEVESTVKAESKPAKDELSLSAIKSPKKQKELLVKLKEFQRQNDVQSSLALRGSESTKPWQKSTPEKRVVTPVKQRNPVSISNARTSTRKSATKRKSSPVTLPLKRFKRTVIKPPTIENGNQEDISPEDGSREQDFEHEVASQTSSPVLNHKDHELTAMASVHNSSCVSDEDIPVLDKHKSRLNVSEMFEELCDDKEDRPENFMKKRKISFSSKNADIDSEAQCSNDNANKSTISEPIVLSSDDENENIPYIDDVPQKTKMRAMSVGLNKNTPPQPSSGLMKSKYFGGAKASGLRKNHPVKKSMKKKSQSSQETNSLKNQPKITSLFSKVTLKTQRKPLSPSKLENEIDHTPELVEDSDINKIKAKMLATRKLFVPTPKR